MQYSDNTLVLPRFYAPDLDGRRETVTLPIEEARHLTRVLRLRAGDEVAVFDGRGAEFRAAIEAAARDTATLRVLEPLPAAASLPMRIVVAQSVLKGRSMDDAVRDATMMGAAAIQPVLSEHVDVKLTIATKAAAIERWKRVALAAVKQSRRATLPEIDVPRPLDEWLDGTATDMCLIFVEPSAPSPARSIKSLLSKAIPASASVLLGPEGGWSVAEVNAAVEKGCIAVTLGPLTLRAESMAVAALAALAAIWDSTSAKAP